MQHYPPETQWNAYSELLRRLAYYHPVTENTLEVHKGELFGHLEGLGLSVNMQKRAFAALSVNHILWNDVLLLIDSYDKDYLEPLLESGDRPLRFRGE